jgi:hypothetical protein
LGNWFAAFQALAILIIGKTFERLIDPRQFLLPTTLGFLRHRLALQCVHTRERANPGPAQLNRPALVAMISDQRQDLQTPLLQQSFDLR